MFQLFYSYPPTHPIKSYIYNYSFFVFIFLNKKKLHRKLALANIIK